MFRPNPVAYNLLLLSVAIGCADVAGPEPTVVAKSDNCTHIQLLHDAGQLKPSVHYEGANGFSFQAFDASGTEARGMQICHDVEASLQQLTAAGVNGATMDYWDSHVRVTAARGLADRDAHKPMDGNGLFRVASTAKAYVGTLASILAVEGKLDLDNADGGHALADYLPEVADRIEYADRITMRQLLNHTSGIPDYFGDGPEWVTHFLDAHMRGKGVTEDEALELIYDRKANFEPGTSAAYNNTGYVLAARIMTKLIGKPYQDQLHERVLGPLGIEDTYFEKHDDFDMERLAHGYRDASEIGYDFDDWYDVDQGYGFANGGIVASIRDVTAFFRAVAGGEEAVPDVDKEAFLRTFRPEGTGYGLGLISVNGRCYGHDGNFTGYSTRATTCPDTGSSVTIFSSSTVPEHEALVDAINASWIERK